MEMIRIAALSILAMMLTACGRGEEPGATLQGTWGWFDPSACEQNRDVIEFAGDRFLQWRSSVGESGFEEGLGVIVREGRDVTYSADDEGLVTATYTSDDNSGVAYEVLFTVEPAMSGGQRALLFRGVTIDGEAPGQASGVIGLPLYYCGEE